MSLNPSFIIRVEKPEIALAQTIAEMQSWLDKHSIQPIEFKIARTGFPGIAFDIQFRSESEAARFQQLFAGLSFD